MLGFGDVYMVYVGDRLGLYRALADHGPVTAGDAASASGTNVRYVREWLEQQAVTGLVSVDDASADPDARRYSLPAEHAEVLLDRDSLNYMSAFLRMMVGMARPLPSVLAAFRDGGGVPYADFDADFVEGQGDANRVQFVNALGGWLAAVPDIDARLRAEPAARVADVACGTGWSSLAIARAYPLVQVDGFDLDEESIRLAQANLESEPELESRVRFEVRDAASLQGAAYDLVTVFEAVHDLARPVEVLRALRGLLAEDGSVVVADERAAERFSAPGDDVERVFYVWSVLHCLPVGMAEQPSAGTGTAMRPDTLRGYAKEAGFGEFEILPIENDFWRFYRVKP